MGKNQLLTQVFGYGYCKMKVKLITLVSDLKHTTWRSLVNIFYMFILAQNDARNAVRSRSALRNCMTEQS